MATPAQYLPQPQPQPQLPPAAPAPAAPRVHASGGFDHRRQPTDFQESVSSMIVTMLSAAVGAVLLWLALRFVGHDLLDLKHPVNWAVYAVAGVVAAAFLWRTLTSLDRLRALGRLQQRRRLSPEQRGVLAAQRESLAADRLARQQRAAAAAAVVHGGQPAALRP